MKDCNIYLNIENPHLIAGTISADNVSVGKSSPEFQQYINEKYVSNILTKNDYFNDNQKSSIRQLLKFNKFKPTGRNKPASEFIYNEIKKNNGFNFINNIVDINNVVSIKTLMPISIFDLELTSKNLEIRTGNEGESYVFNPSGQTIDLKNLICVCELHSGKSNPICNPIKDSMKTKINDKTKNVVGVIYGSKEVVDEVLMTKHLDYFGSLLKEYADATDIEIDVLTT